MSDTNDNVSSLHHPNPLLEPLFHALDPISLILNQQQPFPLRLTTAESFIMERGTRYKAYADLRETRLRIRHHQQQQQQEKPKLTTTPPRKQVKFQGNLVSMRKGCSSSSPSSILTQSVPDFTAALRKENRKPVTNNNNNTTLLPSLMEMTPPMKIFSNNNNEVVLSGSRGSKSASAAREKKKGGILMARKSYASVEELKSLSSATANAINGEGRGGRNRGVMGKSVYGYYRQF